MSVQDCRDDLALVLPPLDRFQFEPAEHAVRSLETPSPPFRDRREASPAAGYPLDRLACVRFRVEYDSCPSPAHPPSERHCEPAFAREVLRAQRCTNSRRTTTSGRSHLSLMLSASGLSEKIARIAALFPDAVPCRAAGIVHSSTTAGGRSTFFRVKCGRSRPRQRRFVRPAPSHQSRYHGIVALQSPRFRRRGDP